MRILLKLISEKDSEYDLKYFHKLQGFIYSLLKETPYSVLHDKKGYKFFCFSNIFPIGRLKVGDTRNLLISSPDELFIRFLEQRLKSLMDIGKTIYIGEMSFKIEDVKLIGTKLNKNARLISATPIIIRVPERNYEKYNIPEEYRKKKYVYWRPIFSFDVFKKQLEENLFKKYREFYKVEVEEFSLFEQVKFNKEVCNHIIINGIEHRVIGSIWEFMFSYLDREQKKILEFGIDCGFGERNSLGFGFINAARVKKI
ncbi:MAG: CRISPR-associated endoribonuclease Cas6 [Candidatus Aenigmatarchaeota archaeon]